MGKRPLGIPELVIACALAFVATGAGASVTRTTSIGPMHLLTPDFGYAVAYRSTPTLFVYERGRWRNATPRGFRAVGIDDVTFFDRRHGRLAATNCPFVVQYRTSDGGRTWRSQGAVGSHSCGGGPTFPGFVDPRHGWMEPVSPNGPAGELLRTADGGVTWWIAAGRRQTRVQITTDAGLHWRTVDARGLPSRISKCAVTRLSAASAQVGRAVARIDHHLGTALYETRDGGRTRHRAALPRWPCRE